MLNFYKVSHLNDLTSAGKKNFSWPWSKKPVNVITTCLMKAALLFLAYLLFERKKEKRGLYMEFV